MLIFDLAPSISTKTVDLTGFRLAALADEPAGWAVINLKAASPRLIAISG
jgi:hypothetical protein